MIVVKGLRARLAIASQLLEAGFRVTTSGTYGVVELLRDSNVRFDLLVTAQSFDEMSHFGVPQLARSVRPELPILVLEFEAAGGAGVIHAVQGAIQRWPLRQILARQYH